MKTGRKSKLTVILDNLDQIREWKKLGATDEQICGQLKISKSSWYKHLSENKEFSEAIKSGVRVFVMDLKGELARQAVKHTLETKKSYVKVDPETGKKTQYTEITSKEVDGNVAAAHLLLKNLDRENWKDDWDKFDFKQQELELRKQIAENAAF